MAKYTPKLVPQITNSILLVFIFKLLTLTACQPNIPDSSTDTNQQNSNTQDTIQPKLNAYLTGEVTEGAWFEKKWENSPYLLFGPPRSEAYLSFLCDANSEQILVDITEYLPDGQLVEVNIITPSGSSIYQAQASNEALPSIEFAIKLDDPLLPKLATTQDKFAVVLDTGDDLLLPATPKISKFLQECR